MKTRLDHDTAQKPCEHCGQLMTITRGGVYEDDQGVAIYLAAMHSCESGKLVDLVIAIRQGFDGAPETCAIALKVRPTASEIQMTVTDAEESFWRGEEYLGRLIDRQQALESPLIDSFFRIADHIVREISEVRHYLAD